MNLIAKKVRCPDCQRLVSPRQQKVGADIRVSCSRCERPLWLWNGIYWRYLGLSAPAEKAPAKAKAKAKAKR